MTEKLAPRMLPAKLAHPIVRDERGLLEAGWQALAANFS